MIYLQSFAFAVKPKAMRMLLPLLLCLLFVPQLARGENTPAPGIKGDFTAIKHTSSNRVDTVIDEQTILMKDGKIVRLLGLEYPLANGENIPPTMIVGKDRLQKLLPEGTEVMFYQRRTQTSGDKTGKVNRMGHVLAHLVRKDNNEWINGTLVADGLAYAVTDALNPAMADQLYKLEEQARAKKLGLWSDNSPYGLLTPDTASHGDSQFRVVEGAVNRAATSKNNLYLNFGDDWRRDFTVMISPALRRTLARNGIDPMSLSGKTVRVRGWIRPWNGPFMELETAERLEIVASPRPSTDPSTIPSTDAVEKPLKINPDPLATGQLNP
ncbi:MAG: nuclease [Micavibrio aeruginosavorus]|uniref:Nuclease n=1 Tax=Micavibrio aeruginosavorus TaxID=349221 RepID=A0A2W5MRS6_9BACT|nr:MAG: nuclease [Micavibrio aeruginosavorus]